MPDKIITKNLNLKMIGQTEPDVNCLEAYKFSTQQLSNKDLKVLGFKVFGRPLYLFSSEILS